MTPPALRRTRSPESRSSRAERRATRGVSHVDARRVAGLTQGEPACKPASVPRDTPGWRPSIWDRRRRRPRAVHQGTRPGQPPGRVAAAVRPLFDLAPGGVYLAGRSPGRWCALTAPFHPCRPARAGRRSALCGTVLRVAPTGGWPAPCPVEAGLSSTPANRGRGRPAGSPCTPSMPPDSGRNGGTQGCQKNAPIRDRTYVRVSRHGVRRVCTHRNAPTARPPAAGSATTPCRSWRVTCRWVQSWSRPGSALGWPCEVGSAMSRRRPKLRQRLD
jgi:hypothetical protein